MPASCAERNSVVARPLLVAGKLSNVVREMVTSTALAAASGVRRKQLLVMDEVDGMSGEQHTDLDNSRAHSWRQRSTYTWQRAYKRCRCSNGDIWRSCRIHGCCLVVYVVGPPCTAAGDRGGVQDLIATIKLSKIPIICICNDKYAQKLRSLRNHVSALLCHTPDGHPTVGWQQSADSRIWVR